MTTESLTFLRRSFLDFLDYYFDMLTYYQQRKNRLDKFKKMVQQKNV